MTRSRPINFLAGAAAIALIGLAAIGCGGGGATASPAPPESTGGRAPTLSVATTGLGNILGDSRGRTLYLFQKDSGTSSCFGACAAAWPPLRSNGKPTVGSALNASRVGTTTRSDGKPQITYNGHPLYLYGGDEKPGDTNGQGLTAFGAPWWMLSPAGNQVTGQASSSGGGGSSYGGGGY
jgi:predicted lipoprotein with Yx(FWY)xxD motif